MFLTVLLKTTHVLFYCYFTFYSKTCCFCSNVVVIFSCYIAVHLFKTMCIKQAINATTKRPQSLLQFLLLINKVLYLSVSLITHHPPTIRGCFGRLPLNYYLPCVCFTPFIFKCFILRGVTRFCFVIYLCTPYSLHYCYITLLRSFVGLSHIIIILTLKFESVFITANASDHYDHK